jgi:hypothetical protein
MTIDVLTILTSGIGFLFFIFLQIIITPHVSRQRVYLSIAGIFACSLILSLGMEMYLYLRYFHQALFIHQDTVIMITMSALFQAILSYVYILTVPGVLDSSVRIRILDEIDSHTLKGISKRRLLQMYDKDVILTRRLDRLLKSGQIYIQKKQYILKKVGLFFIPVILFVSVWRLYLGNIDAFFKKR